MAAVESVINFDWSLGGSKPTATHGSALSGIVEMKGTKVEFILIAYALDEADKAVLCPQGCRQQSVERQGHDQCREPGLLFLQ
jgi:hypothetical protein